jgi:pyruvate dehydrogenase E2 component (dihydrolipoamide acetyltransferase)
MLQSITVPEIGENVESGIVVAVHIKAGDTIVVDDTVIELETDKALVEIPSPFNGKITEVLAQAGAQMQVGDVIARLETDVPVAAGEPHATESAPDTPDAGATATPREPTDEPVAAPAAPPDASSGAPERPPAAAAPSIRRLARELGVDIHDVDGSGPGGRITDADVKAHVRKRTPPSEAAPPAPHQAPVLPDFSRWGEVTVEPMDTVRRLTAQSTATSWQAIPHVTQFDEADITAVMTFLQKNAPKAEKTGTKLTVTAVITRVAAEALKRFPKFNASIDVAADRIIFKRYINIGIAADTPRGLLVPVIRNADRKSIVELAWAIADLATRARNKKVSPDELEGGTFSISNQGGIGGVGFTPIVMWPQVAILGVSRSAVKPVYVHDRVEPRTLLPLSLSYDHRIIDGADAAHFLRWICLGLEQPLHLFLE